MSTDNNKYNPTPSEKKLIEVLINPEHIGKSITDICTIAGVARNVYYNAMQKEGFSEYINALTMDLLKSKVSDLITAAYKVAMTDKGHQDRKMLLTMAGMYTDKQEVDLGNKDDKPFTVKLEGPLADWAE